MLSNISWNEFIGFMAFMIAVYYLFIFILVYRKELLYLLIKLAQVRRNINAADKILSEEVVKEVINPKTDKL